ncbi:hypothetical protein [Ochrovirga pacifica]|uniref:hypothetical protein n=1 Tax=Ochrovirga pacifica TaxID=1042376 RepID=UPI000255920C|nr:hypothetical protein [Ochrovirga pacifica]
MRNAIICLGFFFIHLCAIAQEEYSLSLDKRLFDERKFSTSSIDNPLSLHFKKYLSDDLLANYRWKDSNQPYLFASFEIDKNLKINNFALHGHRYNKSIENKIKKAFLEYDLSKIKIQNHQTSNQYSFIVLQRIQGKTVVKCSDFFAQKSPLVLQGCQYNNSYQEICDCNKSVIKHRINEAIDKKKLSVDYLENDAEYELTLLYGVDKKLKYFVHTAKHNSYIDSMIQVGLAQVPEVKQVGAVNGIPYYFKETVSFKPSKLVFSREKPLGFNVLNYKETQKTKEKKKEQTDPCLDFELNALLSKNIDPKFLLGKLGEEEKKNRTYSYKKTMLYASIKRLHTNSGLVVTTNITDDDLDKQLTKILNKDLKLVSKLLGNRNKFLLGTAYQKKGALKYVSFISRSTVAVKKESKKKIDVSTLKSTRPYTYTENTKLKKWLQSNLDVEYWTDSVQDHYLNKPYELKSLMCYFDLSKKNKMYVVRTNCSSERWNYKLSKIIKKIDPALFNLDTLNHQLNYHVNLGKMILKNNKIEKIYISPNTRISYVSAPLLEGYKYKGYTSTMNDFKNYCHKTLKKITDGAIPVKDVKDRETFIKIEVETSKDGFVKVKRIIVPKSFFIEDRKKYINKIVGKLDQPYRINGKDKNYNYTLSIYLQKSIKQTFREGRDPNKFDASPDFSY